MSRRTSSLLIVLGLLLLVGWLFMSRRTSESAEPPARRDRDEFAADRDQLPPGLAIDTKRALSYLEDLCKIGPRISGSEGMKKQQAWLKKHFEDLGGQVTLQKFTARQKSQRQPVEMANLVISWHPERRRRVLLCSHYDTRPIADQEPDRRKWHQPFVSANDGGSGVALLMEFAHHMKDMKVTVGVDFVFFDGEEYIFNPEPEQDRYFFGSDHFAAEYVRQRGKVQYLGAVLLDMIAGKNPRFPVEEHSLRGMYSAPLAEKLWDIAKKQNCTTFIQEQGPAVLDDHMALNRVRIPAVDIIDFSYAHWHRLSDVPANCSGEGLEQVARVLAIWMQEVQ